MNNKKMPKQLKSETDRTEVQTDIAKLQPIIDAIKAEQRILQEERVRERIARMKSRTDHGSGGF